MKSVHSKFKVGQKVYNIYSGVYRTVQAVHDYVPMSAERHWRYVYNLDSNEKFVDEIWLRELTAKEKEAAWIE